MHREHMFVNKRIAKAVQFFARLSLLSLILLIFIGGSAPSAAGLFPPPIDKIIHTLVYGLMLLLAILSLPNIRWPILFGGVVTVGILDEIHQIWLPGRFAGIDDLFADILGCILMSLILNYAVRSRNELT
jgi:VanZ family protein